MSMSQQCDACLQVMSNMVYALEHQLQPRPQLAGHRYMPTGQQLLNCSLPAARHHMAQVVRSLPTAIPVQQAKQGAASNPAQKGTGAAWAAPLMHTAVRLSERGQQQQLGQ